MNQRPSPYQIAQAKAVLRAERDARKADRPVRVKHKPARAARERDETYLGWLHEGLPCIACLILGPSGHAGRIEAAHQKVQAPSRGLFKRLGVRPHDWQAVPLCAGHHRLDPLCCDPAQTKFWSVVGLDQEDVATFCAELYRAFEAEEDGAAVVREFASIAAGQRAENAIIGRGL